MNLLLVHTNVFRWVTHCCSRIAGLIMIRHDPANCIAQHLIPQRRFHSLTLGGELLVELDPVCFEFSDVASLDYPQEELAKFGYR